MTDQYQTNSTNTFHKEALEPMLSRRNRTATMNPDELPATSAFATFYTASNKSFRQELVRDVRMSKGLTGAKAGAVDDNFVRVGVEAIVEMPGF